MKSEITKYFSKRSGKLRIAGVAILFGLTVVMLLVIAFVSWRSRDGLNRAQEKVRDLGRIDFQISEVRRVVIDAESGQRGFIITGIDEFLEPYNRAQFEKDSILKGFQEKIESYPEIEKDLPELLKLISLRDKDLEKTIKVRRSADLNEISGIVAAEDSKIRTDKIREILRKMRSFLRSEMDNAAIEFRARVDRVALVMNYAAGSALSLGLLGLIFLLGHLRDQIRYIELQRDKESAERSDREKSRFLASMNHEIRTPLNAMLGFSDLLENEVSSERGKKFLLAIQTSGASLAELINDILDLSKIESGSLEISLEPVNLQEFARGVQLIFEEQAINAGLEFGAAISEDCPEVILMDGLRVRQILINFIGNAFKFTNSGAIDLYITSTLTKESGYDFLFSVKDTGRGVPSEMQKIIFEPFKQAEKGDEMRGGTGLGLSISRELARLMGGRITLESIEGVGSDFRLILPGVIAASVDESSSRSSAVKADFAELPKSKILIVDDNPMNRDLIAGYLESSNHEMSFAENGVEALEKMRSSPPDLVLMDIRMPVMSGDQARAIMLEDEYLAGIPVIAVTASSLLKQERRLRRSFDGYIRKPFSRSTLFEEMRDVLGKRSTEPVLLEGPPSRPSEIQGFGGDGMKLRDSEIRKESIAALTEKLRSIQDYRWDHLVRAMIFSDIHSVSYELRELSTEFDSPEVRIYADKMKSLADSFDLAGIEELLSQFERLIDKLS